MSDAQHILISLDPRHAENIFSGRKQVELRRRVMHVAPGTIVWIYVKLPVGSLIGHVKVASVHSLSPTTLWRRFGQVSGLVRREFFDYFSGTKTGVALVLEEAEQLDRPLSLEKLRGIADGFQPPQFFSRITEEHPLFETMTAPS